MRRRNHGNGLLRDVDAEPQTRLINVRETIVNELRPFVRDVQKGALRPRPLDLGVDSARDNVSRRQRATRIIAFHKIFAAVVAQNAAFTAHRFGNEK